MPADGNRKPCACTCSHYPAASHATPEKTRLHLPRSAPATGLLRTAMTRLARNLTSNNQLLQPLIYITGLVEPEPAR